MMRSTFLVVAIAASAAMASVSAARAQSTRAAGPTPVLDRSEQCTDAVVRSAMPIWPKAALRSGAAGWTIVSYDLDGSGRASNAVIVTSTPAQVFDKASLDSVQRSQFTPGLVKAGCKILYTFSLT